MLRGRWLAVTRVGRDAARRARCLTNGGKAGHTFGGSLYTRRRVRIIPRRLLH